MVETFTTGTGVEGRESHDRDILTAVTLAGRRADEAADVENPFEPGFKNIRGRNRPLLQPCNHHRFVFHCNNGSDPVSRD
jgi:hypothetical protein